MFKNGKGNAANAKLNGEWGSKVSVFEKRHTSKLRRSDAEADIAERNAAIEPVDGRGTDVCLTEAA